LPDWDGYSGRSTLEEIKKYVILKEMALNGRFVKIGRILEGLFRDYGWTHEVDWVDAIEWVGECMDLIAAPAQYVDKNTDGNEAIGNPCPIEIKNYRGKLPCDILYIVQAREHDSKIPMRHTTDTFHRGLEKAEADIPETPSGLPFSTPVLVKQQLLKDKNDTDLTYMVNDCYIFTNFKEGKVELSYKAFPIDLDGMPLIPDNIKYVQAVKAYLAEKIAQKLWIQGKLTGDKFNWFQRERDWYIGAATVAGVSPSLDEMEAWKNAFVRLIPSMEMHDTMFKYHGDSQKQKNHNSV
jgi:hypothetical protein